MVYRCAHLHFRSSWCAWLSMRVEAMTKLSSSTAWLTCAHTATATAAVESDAGRRIKSLMTGNSMLFSASKTKNYPILTFDACRRIQSTTRRKLRTKSVLSGSMRPFSSVTARLGGQVSPARLAE